MGKEVQEQIEARFSGCKVQEGPIFDYLGRRIEISKGNTTISMEGNIRKWIEGADAPIGAHAIDVPHTADLFKVDNDSPELTEAQATAFHSTVAQGQWIAQRARPDFATVIAFLAHRVPKPTAQDRLKLGRLLTYAKYTIQQKLHLRPTNQQLEVYIDASHAIHDDQRGHTGVVLTMGGSVIYTRSMRVKRNTKSSTETELMATTDQVPNTIWISHFLESLHIPAITSTPKVWCKQDNTSTITLLNKGPSGNQATRHIEIRHFWMTEFIFYEELILQYCPTEEMLADLFTKAVTTALFRKFKEALGIR